MYTVFIQGIWNQSICNYGHLDTFVEVFLGRLRIMREIHSPTAVQARGCEGWLLALVLE